MVWLIPRSIQSDCALASACSISASTPDLNTSDYLPALWVTSSGKATLRAASWPGWQTRCWSHVLYGPETLRMSDGSAGLDAWTASLRVSRANHTAWQASAPAPVTIAGSGRALSTAFAWLDPVSFTWKMSAESDLLGDWMSFSETWPRSASLLNMTAFAHPTWAPATSANESSFWPTARANDSEKRGILAPDARNGSAAAAQWQTPTTPKGGGKTRGARRSTEMLLPGQAEQWSTPTASDGHKGGGPGNRYGNGALKLSGQATMYWPTPASRDQKGANGEHHLENGTGRLHLDQLPNYVKFCWPTPAASDATRGGEQTEAMTGQTLRQTVNTLYSRPGLDQHSGQRLSPTNRALRPQLNPAFACWLMGWPMWWTHPEAISCAAPAMASYHSKLQSHLSRLLGEQELFERKFA